MRPEWLKCEVCLYYTVQSKVCKLEPSTYEKDRDAYCSHWTCRRCLCPWHAKHGEALIDHSKCQEAIFG